MKLLQFELQEKETYLENLVSLTFDGVFTTPPKYEAHELEKEFDSLEDIFLYLNSGVLKNLRSFSIGDKVTVHEGDDVITYLCMTGGWVVVTYKVVSSPYQDSFKQILEVVDSTSQRYYLVVDLSVLADTICTKKVYHSPSYDNLLAAIVGVHRYAVANLL